MGALHKKGGAKERSCGKHKQPKNSRQDAHNCITRDLESQKGAQFELLSTLLGPQGRIEGRGGV